ncbi:hypothetical protein [Octadecabacter ascidiaceicola]|uniref:Uncharacterized protein n=1 Tax=Octadecabacter ascidiaceicola TaxID=1655543 RepID=A0A238KL99_9RHOB|nr:hypothetical protein [Octadecabacter ascidiaceicola]SMX42852.1 hypothetical protein OCA8868_02863 [Octadecabacter ascidiaceicola]
MMLSRTYSLLAFVLIFGFVLLAQMGVHFVANDALVVLLPGDGCGQVLDFRLQTLVKSCLWGAYIAASLVAFSFATVMTYGRGTILFVLATFASISAFLVGGITNLRYTEHLNSCDIFFMGRDAPNLNFGAVGFLILLVVLALHKAPSQKSI